MKRRAVVAVASGVFATGCGDGQSSDRAEILKVMERGRAALLAGNGRAACDVLTPHGRQRSLGFKVDYDEYGSIPSRSPRLPQTCEQIVRREWQDEHAPNVDPQWTRALRNAKFIVGRIRNSRARARLQVQGPDGPAVNFTLRKTPAGWRIDDSDAIPSGH